MDYVCMRGEMVLVAVVIERKVSYKLSSRGGHGPDYLNGMHL
jgi:hypothetical protein